MTDKKPTPKKYKQEAKQTIKYKNHRGELKEAKINKDGSFRLYDYKFQMYFYSQDDKIKGEEPSDYDLFEHYEVRCICGDWKNDHVLAQIGRFPNSRYGSEYEAYDRIIGKGEEAYYSMSRTAKNPFSACLALLANTI